MLPQPSLHAVHKLSFEANKYITAYTQSHQILSADENELIIKLRSSNQENIDFRGEIAFNSYQGASNPLYLLENYGLTTNSTIPELTLTTLKRFVLKIKSEDSTTWIGKQHIAWGTQTVFAPSDIFNPSSALNPFYRKEGINSLKTNWYLSDLSYLTTVYTWPYSSSYSQTEASSLVNGKLGFQWIGNLFHSDFYLGLIHDGYTKDLLPTLALKGDITEDFSYSIESISTIPNSSESNNDLSTNTDFALGFDGSIDPSILWQLEYYSHSISSSNQTSSQQSTGLTNLSDTHYGLFSITYRLDDFTNLSLSQLTNLADQSALVSLSCQGSILDNLDGVLLTQFLTGNKDQEFSEENIGLKSIIQMNLQLRF